MYVPVPTGFSVAVLRCIGWIMRLLPWRGAWWGGVILGAFWYHVVKVRCQVAASNVDLVFPGIVPEKRGRIVRSSLQRLCASVLEFFKMSTQSDEYIIDTVNIDGMSHYEAAKSRGKGVIVVTGHVGNFDLLACVHAARGVPLAIVSKTMACAGINAYWMRTRRARGVTIFEEGDARGIIKWLKQGRVLGVVVDQRLSERRGGVLIPFFSRRVWTSDGVARLAVHSGAAVLPVFMSRQDTGHRCRIHPELSVPNTKETGDRAKRLMQLIYQCLESAIMSQPEDWMWIHRRFKEGVPMGSHPLEEELP